MKVEILATKCPKCDAFKKLVYKALSELGVDAEVVEVNDPVKIAEKVLFTPALVVNGEVVVSGKVPPYSKIRELLGKAAQK